MKVIVVGLGIQGHKRKKFAGKDYVYSVDPINPDADFQDIKQVPLDSYDAVLACIPDLPKFETIEYCLKHKKHVLVEKPLWTLGEKEILKLEDLAKENNVVCYTAYNHRFEPHFINMQKLINSGELGKIYSCRMFYGNGTARLVRESNWRDEGDGVLPDLGSHLLDTCNFWFGSSIKEFSLNSAHCFENKAPDHVVIESKSPIRICLEMTLCMWRNHFTCDILAENGTAHIESLCKWGPSKFTFRKRILPSGRPTEVSETLVKDDPTWELEYKYFKEIIKKATPTDLNKDLWLQSTLRKLGNEISK